MAPRTETRRNRRGGAGRNGGGGGSSVAQSACDDAADLTCASPQETAAECSPKLQLPSSEFEGADDADEKAPTQSISILKEIFPDHGLTTESTTPQCYAPPAAARAPPAIHQLLGSLPSPARSGAAPPPPRAPAPQMVPPQVPSHGCSSLSQPPTAPPVLPPESFEMQRGMLGPCTNNMTEPPCSNYRERLRAGGRGAFQRAFDMGLVPKNMRQEWSTMSSAPMDNNLAAQEGYGVCGDAQQMWGGGVHSMQGVGGGDYWGQQAAHQQMAPQVTYMQQMPQMMPQAPQMAPQPPQQPPQVFATQMAFQPQQPQLPQPSMSMAPGAPTSVVSLPQAALEGGTPMACMGCPSSMTTPVAASDSTPSDIERCASFLKFSFGDFDNDYMAAQLQAAAHDQVYED